ncbi:hypothetical protein BD310DRAFT_1006428, partial [Dichomitus squalens]
GKCCGAHALSLATATPLAQSPALQPHNRVFQTHDDPREMQPDTSHIHRATECISGRNVNRGHRQNLQNCLHPSMSSHFREYLASVCPYTGHPPCLRSLRSLRES